MSDADEARRMMREIDSVRLTDSRTGYPQSQMSAAEWTLEDHGRDPYVAERPPAHHAVWAGPGGGNGGTGWAGVPGGQYESTGSLGARAVQAEAYAQQQYFNPVTSGGRYADAGAFQQRLRYQPPLQPPPRQYEEPPYAAPSYAERTGSVRGAHAQPQEYRQLQDVMSQYRHMQGEQPAQRQPVYQQPAYPQPPYQQPPYQQLPYQQQMHGGQQWPAQAPPPPQRQPHHGTHHGQSQEARYHGEPVPRHHTDGDETQYSDEDPVSDSEYSEDGFDEPKSEEQKVKDASMRLQSVARGWIARTERRKQEVAARKIQKRFREIQRLKLQAGPAPIPIEDEILEPRMGRSNSLCCLSYKSSLRRGVHGMIYNKYTGAFLLTVIMLNTISMILVAPPSKDWHPINQETTLEENLKPVDTLFTSSMASQETLPSFHPCALSPVARGLAVR